MDPSDVTNVLASAAKAVEDARVDSDLRSVAFQKAVDLIAGASAPPMRLQASAPALAAVAAGGSLAGSGGSPLERLTTRLRLSRDVVDAVYTENGDALAITVHPDKLAKAKSTATREIALLVAAAHQAGSDEATTSDQIRREAEQYDRYDGPNFASALVEMKGNFMIGGSPRAKTFKLTKPGWAAATALVARLGGADKAAP